AEPAAPPGADLKRRTGWQKTGLDRLPRFRGPKEPGGHWPRTITEWADQLAQAELEESERHARQEISNRVIIRPTAPEIAQMEAAFESQNCSLPAAYPSFEGDYPELDEFGESPVASAACQLRFFCCSPVRSSGAASNGFLVTFCTHLLFAFWTRN